MLVVQFSLLKTRIVVFGTRGFCGVFVSEVHKKDIFYSQTTFGSTRRINLSGGGGIRIFLEGPELSSKMKSVAAWMCVSTFLLLIGEM